MFLSGIHNIERTHAQSDLGTLEKKEKILKGMTTLDPRALSFSLRNLDKLHFCMRRKNDRALGRELGMTYGLYAQYSSRGKMESEICFHFLFALEK